MLSVQRGQQPAADGRFNRPGRHAPERQLGLDRDRPGADTLYTKPTVSASSTTISGVTVNSLSSGTFSSALNTTAANFSLTFTQTSNGTPAISTNALVTNGLIAPEGIGDTVAGLVGCATGTVLNAGTVVGNATAAVSGASAATAVFSSGTLQAQVAAGAAYANLSSIVAGGAGSLGNNATILSGANNSGSMADRGHDWRTRATNEAARLFDPSPHGRQRQVLDQRRGGTQRHRREQRNHH